MSVLIVADPAAVAERAVALMQETIDKAVAERGTAHVALSGGGTPGETYRGYAAAGPSPEVRWYFVDERCVPPDSDRSNYGAARRDLFVPGKIPDERVFRMQGERDPEQAAADYANVLCEGLGVDPSAPFDAEGRSLVKLDLVIAGIGSDGHTASLFPKTGAVFRNDQLVTVVDPGGELERRITLTRPVLIAARRVLVLVTGESKRQALSRALLEGDEDEIPSRLYRAAHPAALVWLVDRAAASPP
jgi:6-phosphogluconolactonase